MAENASPSIDPRMNPMKAAPNEHSHINRVIAVMSGKGGVGKSTVTGLLASAMARKGFAVGILDADITGPSIPKLFDVHGRLTAPHDAIEPAESKEGIKMVSTNLMIDREDMPVAWRGPILSNVVKQFFDETNWGDIDYLFVDMPPGTSDVTLTAFQLLPVDGAIIVTSPQDLVEMIVDKAVNLAAEMHVPILGMVENMALFKCPDCGKEHYLFGEPKGAALAEHRHIPSYAMMPIDPDFAKNADAGRIYDCNADEALAAIVAQIESVQY